MKSWGPTFTLTLSILISQNALANSVTDGLSKVSLSNFENALAKNGKSNFNFDHAFERATPGWTLKRMNGTKAILTGGVLRPRRLNIQKQNLDGSMTETTINIPQLPGQIIEAELKETVRANATEIRLKSQTEDRQTMSTAISLSEKYVGNLDYRSVLSQKQTLGKASSSYNIHYRHDYSHNGSVGLSLKWTKNKYFRRVETVKHELTHKELEKIFGVTSENLYTRTVSILDVSMPVELQADSQLVITALVKDPSLPGGHQLQRRILDVKTKKNSGGYTSVELEQRTDLVLDPRMTIDVAEYSVQKNIVSAVKTQQIEVPNVSAAINPTAAPARMYLPVDDRPNAVVD